MQTVKLMTALACSPFTMYKEWLHALMFRAKWEMRIAHRGDPKCLVAPRKRADAVMFVAGPHFCSFKIRRVYAHAWSRPSEALAALGFQHIVPFANSVKNALHALWITLDVQNAFNSAEAWDSNVVDSEGEIVVWELRCMEGR